MKPLSMLDAFRIMGPAFLVSVALVDPGNWATAIEAGSRFGYELVWVVVASNLIAILLQTLAARLGIVTGKHLAEICRESYPPQVCALLWVLCEISIVALDLTMLLGTAIGLNMLLGWPLLPCILMTSLDALLLLLLVPAQGVKKSEVLTVGLLGVVVACFLVDLIVSRPPLRAVVGGLLPRLRRDSVYTAVSLLGANVMPHNFYLHSALVSGQGQAVAAAAAAAAAGGGSPAAAARASYGEIRALCLYNFLDIGAALGVALVINVAVLLVSAATFHSAGVLVHTLQAAHDLMEQTLSSSIAPAAFGTALLCAGQLSTFTGTIAGQVVLQGFLNIHISTWLRRLITRTAAIIPAAVLQYVYGDRGTYKFLLIAQVVLALQLPVTLVPLIKATSSRKLMGPHASSRLMAAAAWGATGLVFLANLMLFVTQMLPQVSASGRGILDKDGPLDLWIDRIADLAYRDPLRASGLLGLLIAASAFLALQLWMIVTPLRVEGTADAGAYGSYDVAAVVPPTCVEMGAGPQGQGTELHGNWDSSSSNVSSSGVSYGKGYSSGGGVGASLYGKSGEQAKFVVSHQKQQQQQQNHHNHQYSHPAAETGHSRSGGGAGDRNMRDGQASTFDDRSTSYGAVTGGSFGLDPFTSAAMSAARAAAGGAGWVIPLSAIQMAGFRGLRQYGSGTRQSLDGGGISVPLQLPWRPRCPRTRRQLRKAAQRRIDGSYSDDSSHSLGSLSVDSYSDSESDGADPDSDAGEGKRDGADTDLGMLAVPPAWDRGRSGSSEAGRETAARHSGAAATLTVPALPLPLPPPPPPASHIVIVPGDVALGVADVLAERQEGANLASHPDEGPVRRAPGDEGGLAGGGRVAAGYPAWEATASALAPACATPSLPHQLDPIPRSATSQATAAAATAPALVSAAGETAAAAGAATGAAGFAVASEFIAAHAHSQDAAGWASDASSTSSARSAARSAARLTGPATQRPPHPVTRGSRRQFALLLDDFWSSFYSAHGLPVGTAEWVAVGGGAAAGASASGAPTVQSVGSGTKATASGSKQQSDPVRHPTPSASGDASAGRGAGASAVDTRSEPPQAPSRILGVGPEAARPAAAGRVSGGGGPGGGRGSRGGGSAAKSATGGGVTAIGGNDGAGGGPGTTSSAAQGAAGPGLMSPLVCDHTDGSHLCMGCSQALFRAVQSCLLVLERLEGAEAAVWGDWPLKLLLPPGNQTFHFHRAVLLAARNADFSALEALCRGTYSSMLDRSKLLAATPIISPTSTTPMQPGATVPGASAAPASASVPPAQGAAVTSAAAVRVPTTTPAAPAHGSSVGGGGVSDWRWLQGVGSSRTDPSPAVSPGHHPAWPPGPGGPGGAGLHRGPGPPLKHSGWMGHFNRGGGGGGGSSSAEEMPSFRTAPSSGGGGDRPVTHGSMWPPVSQAAAPPSSVAVHAPKPPLMRQPAALTNASPPLPPPPQQQQLPPLAPCNPRLTTPSQPESWPEPGLASPGPPPNPQVLLSPQHPPPLLQPPPQQQSAPTLSSWCLFGPAVLVSFGVWSAFTLAQWCAAESRPELWGRYAAVLNRLQGVVWDAQLDTAAADAAAAAAAATAAVGAIWKGQPAAMKVASPSGAEGHQQQQQQLQHSQRGPGRNPYSHHHATASKHQGQAAAGGRHAAHQPVLPPTALRLCAGHLALLRAELLQQLGALEGGPLGRRGPAETAAGEVAFPKGKEILVSVLRRYRRRLAGASGGGGGSQKQRAVAPSPVTAGNDSVGFAAAAARAGAIPPPARVV